MSHRNIVSEMKPIPSEEDWGDYNADLDTQWAYRLFFGKSNKEMQDSFRENVLERVENLRWMPARPFQYYMIGFRDYVKAGKFGFCDEADASCCYLELIIQKLEENPDYILPIISELMETAEYVGMHQEEYDADEDIYGNFKTKLQKIKELLKIK